MLAESENLVTVDKFRKDLTKYLVKLRKGTGPFVLLQDGQVMGVLVAPPAYEAFPDAELTALLEIVRAAGKPNLLSPGYRPIASFGLADDVE